jgi:isoquinoline 1-oxidoreductase alpha subunit
MTSAKLSVNDTEYTLPEVDGVTLQFALRDDLGLTGTKFGCGMSQCGACMVLVDGTPTTSCVTPVASVLDKQITTIEGLAKNGTVHPVQQAWIDIGVPQCGYCQSGQLISAAALLITVLCAPSAVSRSATVLAWPTGFARSARRWTPCWTRPAKAASLMPSHLLEVLQG